MGTRALQSAAYTTRPEGYTTMGAARYLGCSKDTLLNYHRQGRFLPSMIKSDGTRIYTKEDLDAFQAQRLQEQSRPHEPVCVDGYYNVTDAALLLGVNSQRLRRWDNSGRFPASRRDESGKRWYHEDLIREFQEHGRVLPSQKDGE